MLYKPRTGEMKDGCMLFENGRFYLFSMYCKENSTTYNNVRLAISDDGVHFADYGCVIEDFPDCIWAMKVYRGRDTFYMNSGSFTAEGQQAVLKFWKSDDLLHWEYCPALDVIAPNHTQKSSRLDCMNVIEQNGKFYGYATGQYGYLESEDGAHWTPYPSRIDYTPFPPYNSALGGFEIADCINVNGTIFLLCGGFGHLGMDGYGVYLYHSSTPDGIFTPCLPFYRLNGTSHRWVNMWERCFTKEGELLAHNYTYDGYTYEHGSVYLPPIKRLQPFENSLRLTWWKQNDLLYGALEHTVGELVAESPRHDVFTESDGCCEISASVALPEHAIIECSLSLTENKFTRYSCGGIYLAEDDTEGSAILFDTYGRTEILHVQNTTVASTEDVIGFGSTALYHLESGKSYRLRLLIRNGMFEIYVNDVYLQTFNNAHRKEERSHPFVRLSAISRRSSCTLSDVRIFRMAL